MHRMYRVCMHTMKTSQQIKQLMNDYPSKNANYLTIHHLPTFPRDAYMISFNRHTLPSTHTLTSDQSVHDLPLWILTGRPNRPAFRRSGIPGSTLPYSPPSAPPTHGPVSEWSAPRHFTRGVLALGQSEGFVRPFWGFWMRLVIRWLTDYGELTHSVWSTHGINHI